MFDTWVEGMVWISVSPMVRIVEIENGLLEEAGMRKNEEEAAYGEMGCRKRVARQSTGRELRPLRWHKYHVAAIRGDAPRAMCNLLWKIVRCFTTTYLHSSEICH